jgi:pimeloyl-ACP methyl ester carboxylesterase
MTIYDDGERELFHVRAGEAGRPLVFVHGFACAHEDFGPLMEILRDRHIVLACDLRGHGGSAGFASGYDIVTAGMDVAALVERLDVGPAVLVGHSMGCRVVLDAASRRPDLVSAVAFVEGSRTASGDEAAALKAARSAVDRVGYGAFVRGMFEGMFFDNADASIRDHTLERAATLPENVGREYLESTMVYDAARMDEAASRLHCPALLIQTTYFDHDLARRPLAPGQATPWTELVQRHATRSDLHVLSGVGHFPMLEAPAAVRDILDGFIAALAP